MKRSLVLLLLVISCHKTPAAPPARTLITRSLLGTSTQSILLDPFVTTDYSWGHLLPVAFDANDNFEATVEVLQRDYLSLSPLGVSSPVVTFTSFAAAVMKQDSSLAAPASGVIFAPIPGGSTSFSADVWLGVPASASTSSQPVIAELLPNDQPSATFVLDSVAGSTTTLGGTVWTKLALASPVAMVEGGWFAVSIVDVSSAFSLQAPEVFPSSAPAGNAPHMARRTPRHAAALHAYPKLISHRG